MTLWEFDACVEGYLLANRTEEPPAPAMSDEDLGALGIEGFGNG